MGFVEHAQRELDLSGQTEESPGYSASIVAAVAAFASYGHSGGSASVAIQQLHTLLRFRTLSPLTSDPDEWEDCSEISGSPLWQNKRDSAAMSTDAGRSWYYVDGRKSPGDERRKAGRKKQKRINGSDPAPCTHEALREEMGDLRRQLQDMEAERNKWREATRAMADDNRAEQWTAMIDVIKAADLAMDVLNGASMVFSRSGGKTSIGNALVPLMEALTRYHYGPDAKVIRIG
jgi:hypothetical protein